MVACNTDPVAGTVVKAFKGNRHYHRSKWHWLWQMKDGKANAALLLTWAKYSLVVTSIDSSDKVTTVGKTDDNIQRRFF